MNMLTFVGFDPNSSTCVKFPISFADWRLSSEISVAVPNFNNHSEPRRAWVKVKSFILRKKKIFLLMCLDNFND